MNAIQLEFNLKNESESDYRISLIQQQIDQMNESMGKVRRKIFSELSEVKKLCQSLQEENESFKNALKELRNEKTEWDYDKNDLLFKKIG